MFSDRRRSGKYFAARAQKSHVWFVEPFEITKILGLIKNRPARERVAAW
jgi:hypothetical protein